MLDSLNYFFVWTQSGGRKGDIRQYNKDGISRQAIDSLKENRVFDVQKILADIRPTDQDIKFEMLTPEQYKDKLRPVTAPDIPQVYAFTNEDVLLMFAQRDYLQKWETFDLEVDHIAPSAWMSFRAGQTPVTHFWRVWNIQDRQQRYSIQNSIGNQRYWPESLNAGDQANPPSIKLFDVSDRTRKWEFDTEKKIHEASFVQDDLLDDWKSLSTSLMTGSATKIWTTERFATFKRLVDERRYRMYKHLYEMLDFQDFATIAQG